MSHGIVIRPYHPEDEGQIKDLHRIQGHDYPLPDLSSNMAITVVEENGIVTHALALRKTAEAYWIFDPKAPQRDIVGRMLILNKEVPRKARLLGFNDVFCWVPPKVAEVKSFDSMLLNMGWVKPLWTCYTRDM